MGNAIEVSNRRRELFRRVKLNDENLKKVADELAQKHDVGIETIRNEWYNRDEWIGEEFKATNPENNFNELVAEKNEARKEMWNVINELKKEDNPDFRQLISAVKEVDKSADRMVKALQSVGRVHEEPEKHEVKGEVEVSESIYDKLDKIIKARETNE